MADAVRKRLTPLDRLLARRYSEDQPRNADGEFSNDGTGDPNNPDNFPKASGPYVAGVSDALHDRANALAEAMGTKIALSYVDPVFLRE